VVRWKFSSISYHSSYAAIQFGWVLPFSWRIWQFRPAIGSNPSIFVLLSMCLDETLSIDIVLFWHKGRHIRWKSLFTPQNYGFYDYTSLGGAMLVKLQKHTYFFQMMSTGSSAWREGRKLLWNCAFVEVKWQIKVRNRQGQFHSYGEIDSWYFVWLGAKNGHFLYLTSISHNTV
jgi:hypothetical protein